MCRPCGTWPRDATSSTRACGAVTAAVDALETGTMPRSYLRDIVEHVAPSLLVAQRAGHASVPAVVTEHVRQTVHLLVERSPVLSEAVTAGRCAVVGLVYGLVEGRVRIVDVLGDVGVHDLEGHDVSHG